MIFQTELTAEYLRTLPAVRERCQRVFDLAAHGKLQFFDYHPEKEADVAAFCAQLITRDFDSNFASIPPHGRWRHLDAGRPRVEPLIARWKSSQNPPNDREICKRLVDLFLVSVLLDAGAGNAWAYSEPHAHPPATFSRSEGLGVASINMFEDGFFSSDPAQPHIVNADGLSRITVERVAAALQVSDTNPMVGLEGRTSLLSNLASALRNNTLFFGPDARPGNMIDFLEAEGKPDPDGYQVPVAALWHVLIQGLDSIWPASRTTLTGISLGDVWPCAALAAAASTTTPTNASDDLVPFHKLTGWTAYSLMEPLERVLGWKLVGKEDMVGLPEYRNGGLFVDFGVLTLKPGVLPVNLETGIPRVPPSHPAIIEWRAMTVIELDRIADAIRKILGVSEDQLSLAQVLESATWKGGREVAKQKRPHTGGPPIEIESDGTVF